MQVKTRSNPTAHEERYSYTYIDYEVYINTYIYIYIPGNSKVWKRVTQEQMRTTVLVVGVLWLYIYTRVAGRVRYRPGPVLKRCMHALIRPLYFR